MENLLFEKYKTSEVTNTRRVINTPSSFTRKNLFHIQEAGYLKSLKPHLSRRSGLKSYLFMIVLSGTGEVSFRDSKDHPDTVTASPGDCFFLDCLKEYTHISSEHDPWELLWIHFYGPQADAYYSLFLERHTWHFRSAHLAELSDSILNVIRYHEEKAENTDILSAQQIVNILTIITAETSDSENTNAPLSGKLKQVQAYLDEHYTEDISLDRLAEEFYISKYYLSREFKKEFKTTVIQYVLNKRITSAKEFLRYSNDSIESIARQCGIDDASYFNKIFRKVEGCTASEYRKQW